MWTGAAPPPTPYRVNTRLAVRCRTAAQSGMPKKCQKLTRRLLHRARAPDTPPSTPGPAAARQRRRSRCSPPTGRANRQTSTTSADPHARPADRPPQSMLGAGPRLARAAGRRGIPPTYAAPRQNQLIVSTTRRATLPLKAAVGGPAAECSTPRPAPRATDQPPWRMPRVAGPRLAQSAEGGRRVITLCLTY